MPARGRSAGTRCRSDRPHPEGLRVIHQDLGLVADMTVAENVLLDAPAPRRRWISGRADDAATARLLAEFEVPLDPRARTGSLSASEQTMVAIVRAMRAGLDRCALLVLDETTAALPQHETEQLFRLLRRLRDRGGAVLFVTHRLSDALDLADRVTVLRDARRVTTENIAGLDEPGLVQLIVGRPLGDVYPELPIASSEEGLGVDGLTGGLVRDISFSVRQGEVVGFAGLTGSGRESVAALVAGAQPPTSGHVRVLGTRHPHLDPGSAIAAGVAYIPSDRKGLSATPELTVRENVTLPALRPRRGRWLGVRSERVDVRTWLDRLDVRPRDPERMFATLSGGNQQRAVLARWLRCGSRIFVIDEPTQGVDVAGKADIYRSLVGAASEGAAVVIASTDTEELASVCDRVLVMRDGRISAELSGPDLNVHTITHNTLVRT